MKEATGELNMTVITVVAIAAVALLFTMFVLPSIQANIAMTSACANVDQNGNYTVTSDGDGDGDSVQCADWTCTATYNGKQYSKNCKGDA